MLEPLGMTIGRWVEVEQGFREIKEVSQETDGADRNVEVV